MRILTLTTAALIGLAGAAYAAEQIPYRVHIGSSECDLSSGQLEAKAGKPCYDREQTKKEGGGASPNFEGKAAGSQNAGPNNGSDHRQLADSERRDGPSIGDRAKDDDAHDREGDHPEREKQEDDSD
jgi:hypothetical protein